MKKYRFLANDEVVRDGDELQCRFDDGEIYYQKAVVKKSQPRLAYDYSCKIRREIPYEGKVAFLVNYSPLIRVEIDTTGLSDEQIDQKLIEAARAKHCYEHQQYMNDFGDNIDWENTKEDTECP